MAGPTSKCVYIAEDGTHYSVRLPTWEATLGQAVGGSLQTCTAPTTEPPLPKGIRRRKRYLRDNSTGREQAITVLDSGQPVWTAALNHGAIMPTLGNAVPLTDNVTLQGRTGERDKAI